LKTHKTPADQGSGSAPISPQDSGLEEEKNRKTQQTQNTRGVDGERRTTGWEIFEKKSQLPPQYGSDGSFGSDEELDIDSALVSSGSVRGSEPCQGCGQPAEDLIDLPGGSFCETCVAKFAEEDKARKETPITQSAKLKAIYKPSGEALENIEVDAAAEQQDVQEDGVADKQPCGQPADDLPGGSISQSDAVDATRKENPPQAEDQDNLAARVGQTIAQLEAAGKPIIPSLIAEHPAVQGKLPRVVALIRDMGYAMTQEIDPISHMPMWKRPSPEGEEKSGFTPEEDEILLRMVGKVRHQRAMLKAYILADFVRYIQAIPPGRCREWLKSKGGTENPQGEWTLPDDVLAQSDLLNAEFQSSGTNPSLRKHTVEDD
jgi:hypothetical protein